MKDPNRVYWNEQFKILQDTWPKTNNFEKCVEICLTLHEMVHSREVAHSEYWSFEDELWSGMSEESFRKAFKGEQSIAWKLWHSARIEDITMNILIKDEQQVINSNNWLHRLNIKARDTGNAMNEEEIEALSKTIDMQELWAYRLTVGLKTRHIIKSFKPEDLKKKIEPSRLQRIIDEGAVVSEAKGLIDYWGKKTYSGLLLMPATRHIFVHLNEAFRLLGKEERR
ncbi:MAG: DinB family protein [Bacillota bacterium]|nr:DinB family protein [Bacillota bacterium]